jgi:uncharacterized protein with FMN-binding domain
MRRALLAFVTTVAALVMLLSFKTHSPSALTPPPAVLKSTGGVTSSSGTGGAGTGGSRAGTYTGDAADTPFGPVQVRITVAGGKLTGVTAVDYPNGSPRDAEINAYAIPALNSEAAAAGSAHIDMISGATYTSEGYLTSLQSALDKAGL